MSIPQKITAGGLSFRAARMLLRLPAPIRNRGLLRALLILLLFAPRKLLCAELMLRAYLDRRMRWQTLTTGRRAGARIRGSNTKRLKRIIARHGWPGVSLVGPFGAQAAWHLAQHADHDPAFQKRCLVLLREAVRQGEVEARYLAYLTDRVRVAEGRPQRYGTQFHGAAQPLPIEDAEHVDERRAAVGLEPLKQYIERMTRNRNAQPPLHRTEAAE